MIVYASTVIRESKGSQTGHIYKIDWNAQKVENKIPVHTTLKDDLGERGGRRGGRGICIWGESVVVANYDSLGFYDKNLNFQKRISLPKFCSLHEICSSDQGIWVTSTGCEAVMLIDPCTESILYEWYATEENQLLKGPIPIPDVKIEKDIDHRLRLIAGADTKVHLNCVQVHDGRVYLTFSHQSAILQILPEIKIIVHMPTMKNPHNGLRLDKERFIINDTWNQKIRIFSATSGSEIKSIDLRSFPIKIQREGTRFKGLIKVARPGWLRGMSVISKDRVLVGISPASIIEVNLNSSSMVRCFQLTDDIKHSIHGLECANSSAPQEIELPRDESGMVFEPVS